MPKKLYIYTFLLCKQGTTEPYHQVNGTIEIKAANLMEAIQALPDTPVGGAWVGMTTPRYRIAADG